MTIKRENFGLLKSSLRPIVCIQGLGFVGSAMSIAVANSREKNNIIFDVIGLEQPTSEGKNRAKSINKDLSLIMQISQFKKDLNML